MAIPTIMHRISTYIKPQSTHFLRRSLYVPSIPAQLCKNKKPTLYSSRHFASTMAKTYNGNTSEQPPRHEMVYLPGVLSPNRSFGVFRKVLHTGLYSQFVAMEVPVNGEIGDEVSHPRPSKLDSD